jgi:hypothetical protein
MQLAKPSLCRNKICIDKSCQINTASNNTAAANITSISRSITNSFFTLINFFRNILLYELITTQVNAPRRVFTQPFSERLLINSEWQFMRDESREVIRYS